MFDVRGKSQHEQKIGAIDPYSLCRFPYQNPREKRAVARTCCKFVGERQPSVKTYPVVGTFGRHMLHNRIGKRCFITHVGVEYSLSGQRFPCWRPFQTGCWLAGYLLFKRGGCFREMRIPATKGFSEREVSHLDTHLQKLLGSFSASRACWDYKQWSSVAWYN